MFQGADDLLAYLKDENVEKLLSVERTEFRADGAMVVVADDGTRTTIAPNGSVTRELPGGARSSLTIEKPTPPPSTPTPSPTTTPSKAATP